MEFTPETYKRIVSAKLFMDDHLADDLHLKEISKQAFFSPFHFHRVFRAIYSTTPHRYLTEKRLSRAKALLAEGNARTAEVCCIVGFGSIASFTALFKRTHGYTPGVYRKLIIARRKAERQEPKRFVPGCFLQQFRLDN